MAKQKRKVTMPAGIRNKMMAAVSMLMVSAIMMVSSTYAWFTLSTAPEVKNISTTVAGNGSLEIALMPTSGLFGDIGKISSNPNLDLAGAESSNTSWGNIVQLNNAAYGLNTIELNPATLNTTPSTGTTFAENPLAVAVYGYDGRIDSLQASTVLKSYNNSAFSGTGFGVRAIGEADANATIKNTYGYAVDLAFRMNNATGNKNTDGNSVAGKLLLQTEGVQRVYTESTNEATKGGGSYMSFSLNKNSLDLETLMQAVRVTFVRDFGLSGETANYEILGTAQLDYNNAIKGATETAAKLYLYNGTQQLTGDSAVLIDSMEKNTAAQISAIVWLDGNMIKNSSVSASTVNNLLAQATLNLQFSTDVELKPANNNVLFEGSAE